MTESKFHGKCSLCEKKGVCIRTYIIGTLVCADTRVCQWRMEVELMNEMEREEVS